MLNHFLYVHVTLPTQILKVMESFMKELDDFVKIINSCFNKQVSKWKESDLQRVIDWADYFKKACDRMEGRRSLIQSVNKHTQHTCTKYGYLYEGRPIDWEVISCSHGCIFKALIENPNLPNELRNVIYNSYLPSYNMAAKTDRHSTEAFSHRLLEAHSDLSRVLYQQPTPLSFTLIHDAGYIASLANSLASNSSLLSEKLSDISLAKGGMEVILCSLLPEDYRMSLLYLTDSEKSTCHQGNGTEAILGWVLQVMIKPGHVVDQCENYVEKYEPQLLSAISAHHLKFFRGHITCLLEHYMIAFKYLAPTVTAEGLYNRSNWAPIGCSTKKLDLLIQHLKALLQQNEVMHDATVLKVLQYIYLN